MNVVGILLAVGSFLLPGLGQLLSGRVFAAIVHFVFFCMLGVIGLSIVVSVISAINAYKHAPVIETEEEDEEDEDTSEDEDEDEDTDEDEE